MVNAVFRSVNTDYTHPIVDDSKRNRVNRQQCIAGK